MRTKLVALALCLTMILPLAAGAEVAPVLSDPVTLQPIGSAGEGENQPEKPPETQDEKPLEPATEPDAPPADGEEGDNQPPVCELEGCQHIGEDVHGLPVPLCSLGRWELDEWDRQEREGTAPVVFALAGGVIEPTEVDLSLGSVTFYRSGTYILKNGDGSQSISVASNRVVSLTLRGVNAASLSLGGGASARVAFTGRNFLASASSSSQSMTLTGNGSLEIGALSSPVSITGGSVKLGSGGASNASLYVFPASGATSATVDGEAYPFSLPCSDDNAYLWLKAPQVGGAYTAALEGTELRVVSGTPQPLTPTTFDISGPIPFIPAADTAYQIIATGSSYPQNILTQNQSGVSLTLSSLPRGSHVDLTLQSATTVFLSGLSVIDSLAAGGAALSLRGSGALKTGMLSGDSISAVGNFCLSFDAMSGGALGGFTFLPLSSALTMDCRATLDGAAVPLFFSSANPIVALLPLPAAPAGKQYAATLEGTVVAVSTVDAGTQVIELTGGDVHITAAGEYILRGGAGSGSIVVDGGLGGVKLTLEGVRLGGSSGLSIGGGTNVSLIVGGGLNTLLGQTTVGGSMAVSGPGALTLGSLSLSGGSLSISNNTTLATGTSIGGSNLVPTIIAVTGANGQPLAGQAVTLKLGDASPISRTTDAQGRVFLWGAVLQSGMDVAVLSAEGTSAAIISGGAAAPDNRPAINSFRVQDNAIYIDAPDAGTRGVQYIVADQVTGIPDTYLSGAQFAWEQDGRCTLANLTPGKTVSYRVVVAKEPNVILAPATVDAFRFSELQSFVVPDTRISYALAAQSKIYDQQPFGIPSKLLPTKGHYTLAYFDSEGSALRTSPSQVGNYTVKVTIRDTDPVYLPGTVSARISIKRIVINIYPEFYYKFQGEEDPEVFEYKHDVLLRGDAIKGKLTREEGEEPGNYPYLTDKLIAADYYDLRIDDDAEMFYIEENPDNPSDRRFHPFNLLDRIDPVHQIIRFSSGKSLDLIVSTKEKLGISKVNYGSLVTDTLTGETRPFTPSMRLHPGRNEVLLVLETEPELRADGGYATDLDGNKMLRGRTLTLSPYQIVRFKEQSIGHVALQLQNFACMVDLNEFSSERIRDYLKSKGQTITGGRFMVTLEPVQKASELTESESSAQQAVSLGVKAMRVGVWFVNGTQRVDLAPVLRSAMLLADASELLQEETKPVSNLQEVVIGGAKTQAEAAPVQERPTLAGFSAMEERAKARMEKLLFSAIRFEKTASTLDSKLVVPYTASEIPEATYTAVMRTSPYLLTRLRVSGLYGASALSYAVE